MTRLRFQFLVGLLLIAALLTFGSIFFRFTAQVARDAAGICTNAGAEHTSSGEETQQIRHNFCKKVYKLRKKY